MATQYGFGKIVTDGIVLCLDASDKNSYPGTGTSWFDVSGNSNTGTLTNGPTFNSGNGGSIVFDGSNDYVVANRPSQLVTNGAITICMWVKWTTTGTTQSTIQALIDNNHTTGQGFIIQDRPDLSGRPLSFGTLAGAGVYSTSQIGNGTWRHVTGTNNQTTSILYVDAVFNASVSEAGLSTVQSNVSIGRAEGFGRYLSGNIALVQLYNRALSASEVLQNYNATKSRFNL